MRFKLIAFDLDGVLVEEPSAWWTLHQAFGTYEISRENLRAYERDDIDYPEFMRKDIKLWGTRRIQEVEAILGKGLWGSGLHRCIEAENWGQVRP